MGADENLCTAGDFRWQGQRKLELRAWRKLLVSCEVDPMGGDVAGSATDGLSLLRGNCASCDGERLIMATSRAPVLILPTCLYRS